ncbi:MAG: hypothetical protein COV55_00370 [Candidatus Komeilibacteria bacterium CG11_big_fil_rev_8_21_14_0_20_36_20]|uniref:Uncharacterized protein n=2 Tax=Patescibacteria group TaxID=1783273 RepID=A0A2H0NEF5_9BACT|nr:MAG: hypothetical protein COV55_00370 [Candidatus Komeilibacteria bacterium CG11_big_fil_rev_8_21_14_0_20_36_20]PIR82109.1 MAG: hypothetical protein COU21_00065 [Candidatus Komeilibacteria bacterium CG10_big_fil_rev_8_21_14_0_10_36_65]PIZ66453.1 MAG: hypothetical protein COY14_00320 [Candidatus Roizmanbacteria bacterium CG_4_10_14_0_2_um_filter_36_9]PJC55781.1 MAG: hypothetical protein CO027_00265 [Candidatus Komeilibacteria bacterium CG_4_9_14_0_2_um_filter_36_13]
MKTVQKNLIATLLITGFLSSSILCCLLFNSMEMPDHSHHATAASQCCHSNLVFNMVHDTPFIIGDSILEFAFFVFVIVYLFVKSSYQNKLQGIAHYFKIRDRYGGFKLFYYLLAFFSQGILHPKIY